MVRSPGLHYLISGMEMIPEHYLHQRPINDMQEATAAALKKKMQLWLSAHGR